MHPTLSYGLDYAPAARVAAVMRYVNEARQSQGHVQRMPEVVAMEACRLILLSEGLDLILINAEMSYAGQVLNHFKLGMSWREDPEKRMCFTWQGIEPWTSAPSDASPLSDKALWSVSSRTELTGETLSHYMAAWREGIARLQAGWQQTSLDQATPTRAPGIGRARI